MPMDITAIRRYALGKISDAFFFVQCSPRANTAPTAPNKIPISKVRSMEGTVTSTAVISKETAVRPRALAVSQEVQAATEAGSND